ncbi:hypothetical protein [Planctomycetes bacterium TBK1r]|uniref:Uncharacterized protein n=1 Tax=Stieleria magnilauensis TaxID=2527963 RepID=A0ABX5XYW2_9BACT|nr:hypothetical protein TBK1r_59780 [Planctomycetes bacterium TBK1r]QDV87029.1 hypothetical protein TBK1r_60560 [Planctomycetes bacterium TBK1r]
MSQDPQKQPASFVEWASERRQGPLGREGLRQAALDAIAGFDFSQLGDMHLIVVADIVIEHLAKKEANQ